MTRTTRALATAGLAAVLALTGTAAKAADLEVVLRGLKSAEGDARIAVHKRVADVTFPQGGVVAATIRPAREGEIRVVFTGLAPGEYAVAAFHDADGDGKLARNIVGMPTEGFGFSNGATGFMGPPSFDKAAVAVGSKDARVSAVVPISYPGS
ncbi:MAG: DUF2141 domain-containing protein [Defluviicoccus sp.]|nr:DUF2141 domain-containing protein [Defluviicoccus sp.]MDE0276065.1 DUF2141 domain-containing protein [Defluviicoccus sp.]